MRRIQDLCHLIGSEILFLTFFNAVPVTPELSARSAIFSNVMEACFCEDVLSSPFKKRSPPVRWMPCVINISRSSGGAISNAFRTASSILDTDFLSNAKANFRIGILWLLSGIPVIKSTFLWFHNLPEESIKFCRVRTIGNLYLLSWSLRQ